MAIFIKFRDKYESNLSSEISNNVLLNVKTFTFTTVLWHWINDTLTHLINGYDLSLNFDLLGLIMQAKKLKNYFDINLHFDKSTSLLECKAKPLKSIRRIRNYQFQQTQFKTLIVFFNVTIYE